MAIIKIRDKENYQHRHLYDVKRLQEVLLNNGYDADLSDCAEIWEDYSETYGWLSMPDSDIDLWQAVESMVFDRCVNKWA